MPGDSPAVTTPATPRELAPVFVVGCPRSGTTLLYHMLLSAGGFAVYRSESHAFNVLEPRFRPLGRRRNRERLMDAWLDSKLFSVSRLEATDIRKQVLDSAHDAGSFLTTVMAAVAARQGVPRWADCTPEHLLYLNEIKRDIPHALIVHIVRDGRDVALSLAKQGWVRSMPGRRDSPLVASAVYWDWMVRRGRALGRKFGADYLEVRFEQLVRSPEKALQEVSRFIGQPLDLATIQRVGLGSVTQPNSSFKDRAPEETVERWRKHPTESAEAERWIGAGLLSLGYELSEDAPAPISRSLARALYFAYFDAKLLAKRRTPLGRWLVTRRLDWL